MGEVADTLTKKKKKGRPSLIDLQKRALKQEQLHHKTKDESTEELRSSFKNPNSLNPIPNSTRRSNRRNSNPNEGSDEEDEGDERRDKKHRLLHGLNSHTHRQSSNPQSGSCETPDATISRREFDDTCLGSVNTGEKATKATDIIQKSLLESGPSTPLPDKKLLVFILDRLQKKDTYGVYSDPVDPEELPDYHEIIKNPMDFSTLRKKLESGAYVDLEQFEQDVFLICTNAMEYNPADTIYHRQAWAILEMAKKDFENLRQESDEEEPVSQQPKVVKRGRPPGKGLKKQPEPSSNDRTTEISADAAALILGGDTSRSSGVYNLRKTPPSYRFRPADTPVRINHTSDSQSGWSIDWENEFPRSVVKAVNKYGMKHVDENKRDTYNHLSTSMQETSVLTTLEDDLKQLVPVGLKTEYGYARSLARYAANLGPVAWRIATRRIEKVIPTGIEFGPGWVGENPSLENPPQQQSLMLGNQKCPNDFASDSKAISPTTSVSNTIIGNRHSSEETAPAHMVNPDTVQSRPLRQHSTPQNLVKEGKLRTASLQERSFHQFPPDLNDRLVSPNSPGINNSTQAGSSHHPDLALQL